MDEQEALKTKLMFANHIIKYKPRAETELSKKSKEKKQRRYKSDINTTLKAPFKLHQIYHNINYTHSNKDLSKIVVKRLLKSFNRKKDTQTIFSTLSQKNYLFIAKYVLFHDIIYNAGTNIIYSSNKDGDITYTINCDINCGIIKKGTKLYLPTHADIIYRAKTQCIDIELKSNCKIKLIDLSEGYSKDKLINVIIGNIQLNREINEIKQKLDSKLNGVINLIPDYINNTYKYTPFEGKEVEELHDIIGQLANIHYSLSKKK